MNRDRIDELVATIKTDCNEIGRELRFMEVCGTHTVSLFRTGVKSMLPESLRLISGPGCPVCVTSQGYIDTACDAALISGVTICTYGDMVRVPGRNGSLAERRAEGANVVITYSARDALKYAIEHPETKVIFLAVGFETTTPPTAAVIQEAAARNVDNFFVFASHKLVMPALEAVLADPESQIDGFLCPGHVSVIIGSDAYTPVPRDHGKACVIAGFEATQMLEGISHLVKQAKAGEATVENIYGVAVSESGNTVAWGFVEEVFEPADAEWRAMGTIPVSGLALREKYQRFDAVREFDLEVGEDYCPKGCRCGDVIQGKALPTDCPLFGKSCTVANPVGPCMVSSEGTCAAHYKYGRN